MKKILLIACMALLTSSMYAEKGDKYVGGNVNYALDSDYHGFGLGGKVQYEFLDNLQGEGSFNYFFKNKGVSMWELNANLHYLIPLSDERVKAYPLAGVTLLSANVGDGVDNGGSHFGYNLGGGVEYAIAENVKLNAELKYQIVKDWNHLVLSVGVVFPF